ncbi:PQ loop repeat-domain-containing protein [Myxozyma melibiosi]|uniref:PQ loop repeat-domain-containing protein n=1 Tax=Myxozyma melibiosi TaxID=54550 RepID=A0ABR1F8H4_9ASCO
MAAVLSSADALSADSGSSFRLTLSGIFGTISIACWVVLLVPQLVDQWKLKSSAGVSLLFLLVWFLGDIANLIGAVWAGLLPKVVALAVWFCFADAIELSSAIYYRFFYHPPAKNGPSDFESAGGLLAVSSDDDATDDIPLDDLAEESPSGAHSSVWKEYVLPILGVIIIGIIGYFFTNSPTDSSDDSSEEPDSSLSVGPQILGYLSALLYLTARIPQIIQNHRKKSVHGLSLLFFMFSTAGNVTYAAQILLFSSDSRYILLNLSWLLGSLGTVFQDAVIFAQFYIYREKEHGAGVIRLEDELPSRDEA